MPKFLTFDKAIILKKNLQVGFGLDSNDIADSCWLKVIAPLLRSG